MGDSQSKALYRKYRGLSFDDIVGQEHITSVLKSAIASGRTSHAYLFTGPRGVGKTSIARILAHTINGLEYKHEDNHIDIIEIDAASNRRIDEIRDLREKSHIAPVSAKYKVYIIDEVHMLTKEAFNALLKTLEEPPEHVVFILATTEVHKLPQTIVSRTQRHTFRPIQEADAAAHLKNIAEQENIAITDEALELIAKYGDGSFRDAISLLDQASGLDVSPIDTADVRQTLGLGDTAAVQELLHAVYAGEHQRIVTQLQELSAQGIQPEILASQVITTIQQSNEYFSHLDLVSELLLVAGHSQPSLKLELALLTYVSPENTTHQSAPVVSAPAQKPAPVAAPQPKEEPVQEKAQPVQAKVTSEEPEEKKRSESSRPMGNEDWDRIVNVMKSKNNAIASILRNGEHDMDESGKTVTVYVRFAFHEKKLNDKASRAMIQDAMEEVMGGVVNLEVAVDASRTHQKTNQEEKTDHDQLADSIISTFGGGEKVNL